MYEIELKAWIRNFPAVLTATASFAEYLETIDKKDEYFRLDKTDGSHISVRIRNESITNDADTAQNKKKTTVTYKKKESRVTSDGIFFEVNEEHEFTVSDPSEFELILRDSGYQPAHRKHKIARGYQSGRFHIELCTIEELGDFIEIETMSETDDETEISSIQKELEGLIERCGGSLHDIERRYYSDLLAERTTGRVQ